MKSFRTVALASSALLALAACAANVAPVKSTNADDIVPRTDAAAAKGAAELAVAKGGPAKDKRDERLEVVALFPGPEQPVGIAVSKSGRTFMSFPRWGDPVKNTVVELKEGKLTAFPDEATNAFDGTKLDQYPPDQHLISCRRSRSTLRTGSGCSIRRASTSRRTFSTARSCGRTTSTRGSG